MGYFTKCYYCPLWNFKLVDVTLKGIVGSLHKHSYHKNLMKVPIYTSGGNLPLA